METHQETTPTTERIVTEENCTIEDLKLSLKEYKILVENIRESISLYASRGMDTATLEKIHVMYLAELEEIKETEERINILKVRDEKGKEAPMKQKRVSYVIERPPQKPEPRVEENDEKEEKEEKEETPKPLTETKAPMRTQTLSFVFKEAQYNIEICLSSEPKFVWGSKGDLCNVFDHKDRWKRLYLLREKSGGKFEIYYFKFMKTEDDSREISKIQYKALLKQETTARPVLFGFTDLEEDERRQSHSPYILTGYFLNRFIEKINCIDVSEILLIKYEKKSANKYFELKNEK